jgi:putative ABC transport system ATP-binding protein
MAIITLSEISRLYTMGRVTVPALVNISLSIERGDFVAIAGPSGSGKTTMMNIIGLIDKPTRGNVLIKGIHVNGLHRNKLTQLRHEYLGFIFQSFNLLPVLTVFENVELPLLIGKPRDKNKPGGIFFHSKKKRREWVASLLESVGLEDRAGHMPAELSGGQQQRVAIARALVTQPEIVLADEPTANLDSKTGKTILDLMKKMNHEQKTTFIFSTHDDVIRKMADHIIYLKDGTIFSEEKPSPGGA